MPKSLARMMQFVPVVLAIFSLASTGCYVTTPLTTPQWGYQPYGDPTAGYSGLAVQQQVPPNPSHRMAPAPSGSPMRPAPFTPLNGPHINSPAPAAVHAPGLRPSFPAPPAYAEAPNVATRPVGRLTSYSNLGAPQTVLSDGPAFPQQTPLHALPQGDGSQQFTPMPSFPAAQGCAPCPPAGVSCGAPNELAKTTLGNYVIEPPDILLIEGIHIVPKAPYRLRSLDVIGIDVRGTLPDAPIAGAYPVEPGGIVNLGSPYGSVRVAGLTVREARTAIDEHLREYLQDPSVSVAIVQMGASEQIVGEYLVGPDGTITLGSYGSVCVAGRTLEEARAMIEGYLSQFLEQPKIALNVYSYNSKVYYVILQGAGLGDGVFRFPVTGNETVLDAIAQINGLERVSSKKIWIARPTGDPNRPMVLPVDWRAITECAATGSNYQVLPGDRVFIAEDKLVAFDTQLAKLTAPLERIMGFVLLSTGTATRLSGPVLKGGGNPNGGF